MRIALFGAFSDRRYCSSHGDLDRWRKNFYPVDRSERCCKILAIIIITIKTTIRELVSTIIVIVVTENISYVITTLQLESQKSTQEYNLFMVKWRLQVMPKSVRGQYSRILLIAILRRPHRGEEKCEQWAECLRVLYVKPPSKRFIIQLQKGVILIQFYLVRVFFKKCIICPSGRLRTM